MSELVEVDRRDSIAYLTLNRPPLNVLSSPMLEAFAAALEVTADAHVLIVAARGEAFCAGVDVAEHVPEKVGPMLAHFHRACRRLLGLDIPTVAVVQGAALGGGCEIVALCDFALAARSSTFGQPEIKLASFPPVAAAVLASLVGVRQAAALMMLGESISAEAAQAAGLVTTVVDDDQLTQAAEQLAGKLAALSRPALRLAKRAWLAEFRRTFETALERAERLYLNDLIATEDAREGVAAFLEKRTPVWRHR